MYSVAQESVAEHMKFKKFETRANKNASEENFLFFLIIKNDENKKANLYAHPPSCLRWVLSSSVETHFP
jgi:hypothetical protein